jgi:hypothetical protein
MVSVHREPLSGWIVPIGVSGFHDGGEIPTTAAFILPWSDTFGRVRRYMTTAQELIRIIWDAQGYGNVAVYEDGTTAVIAPDETGEKGGRAPATVFKPMPLVGGFPMLDFALGNRELIATVEKALEEAGVHTGE